MCSTLEYDPTDAKLKQCNHDEMTEPSRNLECKWFDMLDGYEKRFLLKYDFDIYDLSQIIICNSIYQVMETNEAPQSSTYFVVISHYSLNREHLVLCAQFLIHCLPLWDIMRIDGPVTTYSGIFYTDYRSLPSIPRICLPLISYIASYLLFNILLG